jgi:HD-like signal output (HDOD) protein
MYDWLRRLCKSRRAVPADAIEDEVDIDDDIDHATSDDGVGISWLQRNEITADFNRWLFSAETNTDLFVTPLEQRVLNALEEIINGKQSGVNLVRRMPGVIPQLLQSLRTDDFSGAELARKISNDVVLVAAVIRLANNAFYGMDKPITSIEHAVLVLGQDGLRQLISGVAFKPIINLKSGYFTQMIAPRCWRQAELCALAARVLAEDEPVNSFEGFLAGLIQYVGLIVSLRVMDQITEGDTRLGSESFCNSLISHARKLSCSIAREWQFPTAVVTAIEEQGSRSRLAQLSATGRVLSTADFLSKYQVLSEHDVNLSIEHRGLSEQARTCLAVLAESSAAEAAAEAAATDDDKQ